LISSSLSFFSLASLASSSLLKISDFSRAYRCVLSALDLVVVYVYPDIIELGFGGGLFAIGGRM